MVTCVHLHALIHLVFLSVFVSCKKKKKKVAQTTKATVFILFIIYMFLLIWESILKILAHNIVTVYFLRGKFDVYDTLDEIVSSNNGCNKYIYNVTYTSKKYA